MSTITNSICSYCGVGCGIKVSKSRDGEISLEGNEDYPVNHGMLCSKGMNLHHVVNDKQDRLLYPQMRTSRHYPLKRVSWESAIKRSAAVFKTMVDKYGPDSVGLYVSGQMLIEEYYLANKLTKGFLGTNNIDTNSRLCMSSAVVGYKKTVGADSVPINYNDIELTDCFFITGANPAWCHPILFRRIEKRLASKHVKMIVVDPRKTQTAEMADLHLQIQPGTDVYVYEAISKYLIDNGHADFGFMEKYCEGHEAYINSLKNVDIAENAAISQIPLKEVELAGKIIGESEHLLTMWAMGLNQSSIGVNKNLSLIQINLLTGRIGKPGSGPFSLTGQPNAMGGREVGGLANLLAAHRDLLNEDHRREVEQFWDIKEGTIKGKPGLTATEMVEALESGKLKAVWIICTNPAVSLPDLDRTEKAFANAKFVMVSDISNRADTLRFADVILPAAGWLEKEGTMTNSDRRVAYLPKMIDAPGEAKPDYDILRDFAHALGHEKSFNYKCAEDIFKEHCALTKGTNIDITGLSYNRLRNGSVQWPCPEIGHPGTDRLFEDFQFHTPSGKAQFHVIPQACQSEPLSKDFPFILTTGRIRDQWHTMTRTGKVGKLRKHIDRPYLEVHPEDAKRLAIADGDTLRIFNERGETLAPAKITDSIKEGTVFLPMHFGRLKGNTKGRANNLTSMIVDPVSKEPDFKYSAVQVEPVRAKGEQILIVGAGQAARQFVKTYRKKNKEDRIIVFGKEPLPFYNRVLLPDYINNEKNWNSLIQMNEKENKELDFEFVQGMEIIDIDRTNQVIKTQYGKEYPYDKLILATGSRPATPSFTPPNYDGIFGLRTRKDADLIKSYLDSGDEAVVIGGGLLGLELSGSLASLGIKVTILQRSSRLMRGQLDTTGSNILHEEILDRGIDVIYNDEIESCFAKEDVLHSIRLKSGRRLKCKALFFATGIKPNIEIGVKAGLKAQKGLVVNNQLQTSDSNIYAIGEIAEHKNKLYGTTPAAQEQANICAKVLLGDETIHYNGSLGFNVLKLKDLNLCSIGTVEKPNNDPCYHEVITLDYKMRYYKKCILYNDRIIGAILIGDKTEFSDFKTMIENETELGEKRTSLLKSQEESIPVIGELVCSCNNVGDGNLKQLIAGGYCSMEALCNASKAGLGCGSCKPEVQKILQQELSEKEV
ncbi:MAG: molybdopterin-dependent oxidoreductase [Lentisphaeria bacterium]|nr:molybdopterin-dependent oxidoreductase [Lentisphaeria bacterium]